MTQTGTIGEILARAPVIPVLTIDDPAHARAIAEALVWQGLPVLEVTLRTPAGLDAIAAMQQVAGAVVGAGSVVNERQVDQSLRAGARFLVSPGLTRTVCGPAAASGVPYLPGISSPSDIMRGLDLGLTCFKFFPAEAAGGMRALRALSAPFPDCRFCPTGGITPDTAPHWLALPMVTCVGGSWFVQPGVPDVAAIRTLAARAAALGRT